MALQHLVGPACCALIALSAAAAAQGKQDRGRLDPITETEPATKDDPNKLAADLVRMRLELQRLVIDEERLLELRIRHGLGLTMDGAAPFLVQEGDRAVAMSTSDRTLRDEEGQLADLTRQFDEMKRKVAPDKARNPAVGDLEFPKGSDHDTARKPPSNRTPESRPSPAQRPDPRAQDVPASRPKDLRHARSDAPPKLLISGSTDRSTVGRVLFRAGRYKEARAELEEAVKAEPPDLQDHFLLGQCLERLGEPATADNWYKKIEALDSKETPQGKVAGPWAEAARAASRQMDWMVDHGQWKLPRPIDSIEWRKGRR